MSRKHPFFRPAGLMPMVHRGAHGPGVTENTLEAFQRAVDLGYEYIESDLQVTADGIVVMSHDPDLRRVAELPERIADLTYSQLSTIRLKHGEVMPRLDEVLASFPQAKFNLDAKVPEAVVPAISVIGRTSEPERVCIGSFSHRSVVVLRSLLPRVAHSASPREVLRWRLGLRNLSAHAFMVPIRSTVAPLVTATTVARAHEIDATVHVWTVNDPDEMRRLIKLGVDGLMTDRAEVLKDVLQSEGVW